MLSNSFWASYIALKPSSDYACRLLNDIHQHLSDVSKHISFHEAEYLHLTLLYLGWTNSEHAKAVSNILKKASVFLNQLDLQFTGEVRLFGWEKKQEDLVLLIDDKNGFLHQLQVFLTNSCIKYGIHFNQQDFIPHITIGKVNINKTNRIVDQMSIPILKEKVDIHDLCLLESICMSRKVSSIKEEINEEY